MSERGGRKGRGILNNVFSPPMWFSCLWATPGRYANAPPVQAGIRYICMLYTMCMSCMILYFLQSGRSLAERSSRTASRPARRSVARVSYAGPVPLRLHQRCGSRDPGAPDQIKTAPQVSQPNQFTLTYKL